MHGHGRNKPTNLSFLIYLFSFFYLFVTHLLVFNLHAAIYRTLNLWSTTKHHEGDQELAQVAQRSCKVSFLGDIKKTTWTSFWATESRWPFLSRKVGSDDVQSSIPTSATLTQRTFSIPFLTFSSFPLCRLSPKVAQPLQFFTTLTLSVKCNSRVM